MNRKYVIKKTQNDSWCHSTETRMWITRVTKLWLSKSCAECERTKFQTNKTMDKIKHRVLLCDSDLMNSYEEGVFLLFGGFSLVMRQTVSALSGQGWMKWHGGQARRYEVFSFCFGLVCYFPLFWLGWFFSDRRSRVLWFAIVVWAV